MVIREPVVTAQAFEAFATLPENADKRLELVGGEIVEVPSNPFASKISMRIGRHLGNFVDAHDLGHITGEAGGYQVLGERYAPDVAFISKARQPQLATEGYNPNPPDLAVEVEFPATRESQHRLTIKLAAYLAAGTTLWVVYPETQQVHVFAPGQPVNIVGRGGALDGGDILPGFSLPVKDIFPA